MKDKIEYTDRYAPPGEKRFLRLSEEEVTDLLGRPIRRGLWTPQSDLSKDIRTLAVRVGKSEAAPEWFDHHRHGNINRMTVHEEGEGVTFEGPWVPDETPIDVSALDHDEIEVYREASRRHRNLTPKEARQLGYLAARVPVEPYKEEGLAWPTSPSMHRRRGDKTKPGKWMLVKGDEVLAYNLSSIDDAMDRVYDDLSSKHLAEVMGVSAEKA
jgi:hypothetical protein